MPPERNGVDRLALPAPNQLLRHYGSIFELRPNPLRSVNEHVDGQHRRSGSPVSSCRNSGEAHARQSSIDGQAQDNEIALLLADNLDFYDGWKYLKSIEKDISECDPKLLPNPLFFDPEDRRVVLPLRRTSHLPENNWHESPLVLQEVELPTSTAGDTAPHKRSHACGPLIGPPPTLGDKRKRLTRRSLSSPSKPEWYDLPRKERERLVEDASRAPSIPETVSLESNGSVISRIGRSLWPGNILEQLSPAKKFTRSPRALLFASPPSNDDHIHNESTYGMERAVTAQGFSEKHRIALPRMGLDDTMISISTDPFTADPLEFGGLALRSGPWSQHLRPFPREMTKVMLADMAKEGWFEVGDTWIYFRLVTTMKEDVYLNKELKICKVREDGTLTLAVPKGPLRKLPEVQHSIDRRPIPPPRGEPTSPFPDSPTLPCNSSNVTLLRHTVRAQWQEVAPWEFRARTPAHQPATPSSRAKYEGINLASIRDNSTSTPKNRIMGIDLARSGSVRATPTYGPRPQPPRRGPSASVSSTEAITVEIKLLQDLERRIFDLDDRVVGSRRYEFGSNIWKQIRCLRGNRDLGTLWDMRQECAKEWKRDGK